jgi:release factor H-coupled RctB family protein
MGTPKRLDANGVPVSLFFSESTWVEGNAIAQLEHTAALPGMIRAAAFPDLHPGRGIPVGAAFLSEDRFYPHLIGNDIGCGIGLWNTHLPVRKAKLDRWVRRLEALASPWDGDLEPWLEAFQLEPESADTAFGTIGSGNHFAELVKVMKVADPAAFARLGLEDQSFQLLVHTGSRGLGDVIYRAHAADHGAGALMADTQEAESYLCKHNHACRWAEANRALVAHRFLACLGTEGKRVCDSTHNSLTRTPEGWLHRKGASEGDRGPVLLAGSRGTPTFLVQPLVEDPDCLRSLAHGAGRKWQRSDMKARLSGRFRPEQLRQTELGGRVICADKDLLYEEAPQAYKDIHSVIDDLQSMGLVSVIASFVPVITYKTA